MQECVLAHAEKVGQIGIGHTARGQQPLLEDFLRAMAEANEPPMPTPVGDPTLGLVTPGVQIPEVDIEASLSAWV